MDTTKNYRLSSTRLIWLCEIIEPKAMAVHRHNSMMSQGIFMMQKLYFDSINHTLIAEEEKKNSLLKGKKIVPIEKQAIYRIDLE